MRKPIKPITKIPIEVLLMGVLMIMILSLASCKGQEMTAAENRNAEHGSPPLTLIMKDAYGGMEEEQLQVIRDPEGLKRFFAKINKTRKPGIPVPNIDFEKELVVIYHGGKTREAQLPELYRVKESNDQLVIGKRTNTKSGSSATAITQPFALYTLPRTQKEVILGQPQP